MEKRLGIFVLYDNDGILDQYVYYLLDSLSIIVCESILVVNGELQDCYIQKLDKYSSKILWRENVGYDGGAYKDAIEKYLGNGKIAEYDELLLCNTSFYGPFFPWEQILKVMKKCNVDFWGLSRYSKDERFSEHLQGYFILCKNELISSKFFGDFWRDLDYPNTYMEAVRNFEVRFTHYFEQKGFLYNAYIDAAIPEIVAEPGEVIYMTKSLELLETKKFPILKKKAFTGLEVERNDKILSAISMFSDYPIEYIIEHHDRLCLKQLNCPMNSFYLEKFYLSKKDVFIFGNGHWGKIVTDLFAYKGWTYKGIVLSSPPKSDDSVVAIDELKLAPEDGLIVIVGIKVFQEIAEKLLNRFTKEQLLVPFGFWEKLDL